MSLSVEVPRQRETLLRCVNPNKLFVTNLCSRLPTDVVLDERTKQQLKSSSLTNYEKNQVLLDWLNGSSTEAFTAFLSALRDSQQQHLVEFLEGAYGKLSKIFLNGR